MNTPTITVFGIPNCDTVKKARAWLDAAGLPYSFHDFKKHGVPPDLLAQWTAAVGWEKLLNRKGTTWRTLDAATQAGVTDAASAQSVMQAHASVVKRPVVQWSADSTNITVGFDAAAWAERAT